MTFSWEAISDQGPSEREPYREPYPHENTLDYCLGTSDDVGGDPGVNTGGDTGESVNHPHSSGCDLIAPGGSASGIKKSKNAQANREARAIAKESLDRLRFIFIE